MKLERSGIRSPRAIGLVAIALFCFAGNSILCRLALASREIDAATFTSIRLLAGALVLSFFALRRARPAKHSAWASALALFAYAAPFSFAYLEIGAAVGALVLFGTVQATMIGWGLVRGERPTAFAWVGIVLAVAGLAALTLPGTSAPNLLGTLAMVGAGAAWAVYTLLGRTVVGDPLAATSMSFLRSVPFAALLFVLALAVSGFHASPKGVVLAVLSGAVTSGLGYSVWYAALAYLSRTEAAVLQLTVPIIAAAAAVVLLGESVSARLALASLAILGGVALTIRASA
jgi:drug/metabolite transporter (DMT)-like permease